MTVKTVSPVSSSGLSRNTTPKTPCTLNPISFIRGEVSEENGYAFDEILELDNEILYKTVNWMHKVFPTGRPAGRWTITSELMGQFQQPRCQKQMRTAYQRALKLFSLDDCSSDCWDIRKSFPDWVVAGGRHYTRIARIVTSLKLAGLNREVLDFARRLNFACEWAGPRIDPRVKKLWSDAFNYILT